MHIKNFALIGAAGYVAPRHLKAIQSTGNTLLAAYDPFDSVGVLDSYFPNTAFFVEFERFDRHIDKFKRQGVHLDYVSICSPNYLHDSHIRFALRNGANVICEKPLVLNPWNVEPLLALQQETGRKINTILQLRLHPNLLQLKKEIDAADASKIYAIDLTYITSRGSWYYTSWKGDISKSGGIATNIGIHFFDMLYWLFGKPLQSKVHLHTHDRAAGYLEFGKARVKWFLSIDASTLPAHTKDSTYRSMVINGNEIEFSDGFADLHNESYKQILNGNGFTIQDALPSIEMVYYIRNASLTPLDSDCHPLAKLPVSKHPFYNL